MHKSRGPAFSLTEIPFNGGRTMIFSNDLTTNFHSCFRIRLKIFSSQVLAKSSKLKNEIFLL